MAGLFDDIPEANHKSGEGLFDDIPAVAPPKLPRTATTGFIERLFGGGARGADPMGTGAAEILAAAAPPAPTSVLEGVQFPPQPVGIDFRAASARALSPAAPRARAPSEARPSLPVDQGFLANAERIMRKTVGGIEQGKSGLLRMAGDVAGLNGVSEFAQDWNRSATELANRTEGGKTTIDGFTPLSIVQDLPAAAEGATVSIAQQLPALATGNIPAALAIMFGQSTGQQFNEVRDKGLDIAPAVLNAVLTGGAEVVGEKFGGTPGTMKAIKGALAGNAPARVAADMARAGLRDLPGELGTTAMQYGTDAAPWIGTNKNPSFGELGGQLKDTALQTVLQGGVMSGSAAALAGAAQAAGANSAPPEMTPAEAAPAGPAALEATADQPRQSGAIDRWLAGRQAAAEIDRAAQEFADEPAPQVAHQAVAGIFADLPDAPAAVPAARAADVAASPATTAPENQQIPPPKDAIGNAEPLAPDVMQQLITEGWTPPATEQHNAPAQAAPAAKVGADPFTDIPAAASAGAAPAQAAGLEPELAKNADLHQIANSGPQRVGRNNVPLADGGKPFRSKLQADTARKGQPMLRVVKVDGGYALADKTPAQLAAQEMASRRLRNPQTSPAGQAIPAHAMIAAAGGLHPATRADMGMQGNVTVGNRKLFAGAGRGLTIERATEKLIEDGYLPDGAGHDQARELLKRSLAIPQYTPEGTERMAQADADVRFEDHLAAQQDAAAEDPDFDPFPAGDGWLEADQQEAGYDVASPEIQAEVHALIAMADATGIDSESLKLDAHDATRNGTTQEYYEQAKSALENAIAGSNRNSSEDAGQPSSARQPTGETGAAEPDAGAEGLTSYTESDVLGRLEKLEQAQQDSKDQAAKADADSKKERERKDIASRQDASAENFELGQDADDALSGQQGMFSRPADTAPEANALKALSENDILFALARSDKNNVAGIVADTAPDITVQKSNDPAGRTVYTFTMPDGKKATMSVRPFNKYATEEAPTLYGYDEQDGELSGFVTERPGNNPEDAGELDDVWVDVSGLDTGGNGAKIYNIAETFAHNTGRIFIGDPAGLTDAALSRRTEQMLSSALKFGTTKHVAPHPRQVAGDPKLGVPALDWTYGDHIGNIEALIRTSLATYNDVNPLTFEPSTGRFLDSEGGQLDDDSIRQIARIGRGREAGAGLTTLKRGAVFNALVRESGGTGGGGRQGAGLLEKLVVLAGQSGASTDGIFYSRNADGAPSASTSDSVRQALTERFGPLVAKMEARGFLKIWDDTQQFNKEAKRSEHITGVAQGLWDGKTAHLFADGIEPGSEAAVMAHEVGEHASMQQMLGPKKYAALVDRAHTLMFADDPVALEAVARIPEDTKPEHRDSELLAYMIETTIAAGDKATPGARKWLADVIAAIRAWWFQTGLNHSLSRYGKGLELTPEDIAALAVRAVNWKGSQSTQQGDIQLSRPAGAPAAGGRARPLPASSSWTAPPGSPPVNPATGAVVPQPWNVAEPGTIDNFVRAIQNNKIDLKRIREAIEARHGRMAAQTDAYLSEELYHGKVSARVTALHELQVEPILKKIAVAGQNVGITLDDVNQYLHAMHAPERNAAMKAINPGMPNNAALSGMSDADAAKLLADFTAAGKTPGLASIAADVYQLLSDTRTGMVADGLEDAGTVQAWEQAYQHYAPLQRDIKSSGTPKGQGISVRGPEAKRAMGSNKDVVNILANIVAQAETAAIRAEKAIVGRALLEMARQHPNPAFWKVDAAPTKPRIDKETGLVIRNAIDPMFQTADNVVMVKDYGLEHFIVFEKNSERAMAVAKAMKNLDVAPMNKILEVASKGTRFIASLLTQRNPLFWMTNFSRDIQGALLNLQGTDAEGLQAKVLGNLPKAFKGMHALVRGDGAGQWARYAQEMQEAGGTTGYMQQFENSDARMDDLKTIVAQMQQGKADPRRLARVALEFVDDYNDIIENAVRLSVFQAARHNGVTAAKAASIAKNITVNFNRKGNLSPPINALYMFFNASVQGTARLTQALATSRSAQVLVGGIAVMGFLLDALNRAMSDDDEETGRNRYDMISEFEKSKNWIFMNPMRPGEYVKVPLPLGPHVFHNAGRLLSDAAFRKDKRNAAEYGWSMASTVLDAFSPLGATPSAGQLIAPSVLDPVVQLAENKSFTGGPVFKSEDMGFGKTDPKPAYTRHFESTPDVWKAASRALNDLSGGDKDKPGRLNVEPDILKHVFYAMTGGPGRMLDQTTDAAQAQARGDKPSVNRVPFVSRFYGENDDRQRERVYYDDRKHAMDTKTRFDYFSKIGRPDLAREVAEELGDGDLAKGRRMMREHTSAQSSVRKINKQIRIELQKQETGEDRAEQLRALKQRRVKVMGGAGRETEEE